MGSPVWSHEKMENALGQLKSLEQKPRFGPQTNILQNPSDQYFLKLQSAASCILQQVANFLRDLWRPRGNVTNFLPAWQAFERSSFRDLTSLFSTDVQARGFIEELTWRWNILAVQLVVSRVQKHHFQWGLQASSYFARKSSDPQVRWSSLSLPSSRSNESLAGVGFESCPEWLAWKATAELHAWKAVTCTDDLGG